MNNITATASAYIGVPYVWGGEDPTGFDCSGLMQYAYKQNGINIPRVAQDQYNSSTKITKEQLKEGDLIFSGTSTKNITHVVMYAGNNEVIEAPRTGLKVRRISLDKIKNVVGYGTYLGTDSVTTSQLTSTTTAPTTATTVGFMGIDWDEIWANIVLFIFMVLVAVLGVVFFTKAFDIKIL